MKQKPPKRIFAKVHQKIPGLLEGPGIERANDGSLTILSTEPYHEYLSADHIARFRRSLTRVASRHVDEKTNLEVRTRTMAARSWLSYLDESLDSNSYLHKTTYWEFQVHRGIEDGEKVWIGNCNAPEKCTVSAKTLKDLHARLCKKFEEKKPDRFTIVIHGP